MPEQPAASVEDVVSNCPFCGCADLEDWQATMLHEAHDNLEVLALAEPGSSEFKEALAEARRFVGVSPEPSAAITLLRAIRRDIRNNEPTWMGSVGGWEWGAGFFKGFGVGFNLRSDEFDLTLGPFAIGGIRHAR